MSKHIVSLDYPQVLLQYLQEQGLDTTTLLNASGITENELKLDNHFISTEQYQLLIEAALELSQESDLALTLGQRQHLATHGALGYAILSSADISQVFELVSRYIHTRNRLVNFEFFYEDDDAVCRIEVKHANASLYQHCIELAFSSIAQIVNNICQQAPPHYRLSVSFAPKHLARYKAIFGQQPSCHAQFNELRWPATCFDSINLLSNPAFAQLALQQCQDIAQQLEQQSDLAQQILLLLSCQSGYLPSQEQVAQQLHLSPRTLSRRLAKLDTSFVKLKNQAREKLAKEYLSQPVPSIEEIAYLLDYESLPNFSRAFKRWSGLSPSHYRQQKLA